ncbi:hypothetical protein [Magnetospirillum molischianum]|uniref:Transmembrane protein n=1 Tax=Magnetospirillum molischianum DSM 120 TaxID=1150626 RepID=H8FQ56_MAGML|nr:hypothetical protein [Magnetospirillum molischianum]CCG40494.1 conserved membrane hypothetical protein [Magnetospirillum molischianum DSM 120]
MLKRIHVAAGALALLTLLSFWTSSVWVECFQDEASVAAVKGTIVKGLFVLVPAMAAAGITGASLSKGRGGMLVARKTRRMRILAAIGALLMIPAALFLNSKATAGEMDGLFYLVQALELTAGALQIRFMILNVRDGLRMSGHLGGGLNHD